MRRRRSSAGSAGTRQTPKIRCGTRACVAEASSLSTCIASLIGSITAKLANASDKFLSCNVCKHAFSFYPVYAENAPARLPFQEFIVGMAMKACHVLQFYLRLSFVLSVWLLLIPFITFWIWRLAFVRSFREAQILFLSHISTTVILTDCLHGFLLSASSFHIFLVVAHMCSNSAPAAPPEQSNRNIAGEGNGEDAGGIHGIAGLDDADGAEDVHEHTHFDELFGMKGPVFCLVKNPSIVLLGIMEFLGVVIFVPFSLGRIILYYVSWVFSSASGPVLSTVMPLTETALPLANITLKNAFSVVTNLTSEG
ncbi:hypothetical protein Q3G72_018881 [Acer saccharum]|nr:hypothetical protein Q3G72_018881 [Acer saccharum]